METQAFELEELSDFIGFFKTPGLEIPQEKLHPSDIPQRRSKKGTIGRDTKAYHRESTDAHLKYLHSFLRSVRNSFIDLPREASLINDPEIGYCFPSDQTFREFVGEGGEEAERLKDDFCNVSAPRLKQWLNNFIFDINESKKDKCVRIIAGKVGSGKTTFIEYLNIAYKDYMRCRNVVCTTLYYRDFELRSRAMQGTEWQSFLENLFTEKLLLAVLDDPLCRSVLESESFQDYFLRNVKRRIILTGDGNERSEEELVRQAIWLLEKIKTLLEAKKEGDEASWDALQGVGSTTQTTILRYLWDCANVKYLIILDGLDQLSIDDITEGIYVDIFKAVQNIVITPGGLRGIENIPMHYLLTFRSCTHETFMAKNLREYGLQHVVRLLVPAGATTILRRAILHYVYQNREKGFISKNKEKFLKFSMSLLDIIKDAFTIQQSGELAEIFNFNYREMLRYIIEVYTFVSQDILQESGAPEDLEDFITQLLIANERRQYHKKRYRFMEVFLLASKKGFENYYDSGKDIIHRDTNVGFVDNVYNYHLRMSPGDKLPPMLVKIRILQILIEGEYQNYENIQRKLVQLGYALKQPELKRTLRLLQGAGLVKVRFYQDELNYNATRMGTHLVRKLCNELVYVENVAHTTLFPSCVAGSLISIFKEDLEEWIMASIFNAFIFFQYLTFVERLEQNHAQEGEGQEMARRFAVSKSMEQNLENSLRGILTQGRYDRSISIKSIKSRLDGLLRSWRKHQILKDGRQLSLFSEMC